MSEQEKMDRLLRQVMAATPTPNLSSAFDQRLMKQLRPRRLDSTGRLAMTAYALLALTVSIWVMREQGIDWSATAIAVLAPLILALAVQRRHSYLRKVTSP
jgi:hypothetical protein